MRAPWAFLGQWGCRESRVGPVTRGLERIAGRRTSRSRSNRGCAPPSRGPSPPGRGRAAPGRGPSPPGRGRAAPGRGPTLLGRGPTPRDRDRGARPPLSSSGASLDHDTITTRSCIIFKSRDRSFNLAVGPTTNVYFCKFICTTITTVINLITCFSFRSSLNPVHTSCKTCWQNGYIINIR